MIGVLAGLVVHTGERTLAFLVGGGIGTVLGWIMRGWANDDDRNRR